MSHVARVTRRAARASQQPQPLSGLVSYSTQAVRTPHGYILAERQSSSSLTRHDTLLQSTPLYARGPTRPGASSRHITQSAVRIPQSRHTHAFRLHASGVSDVIVRVAFSTDAEGR